MNFINGRRWYGTIRMAAVLACVDGVNYLVLGAGGAPQAFDLTTNPSPEEELYWKGQNRVEEYNYLKVTVDGPNIKGIIHRFRPTDTIKPLSNAEVFGN